MVDLFKFYGLRDRNKRCVDALDCCSSERRQERGSRGRIKYYSGDSANVSRLLDSLLRGYDPRLRPNYNGQLLYQNSAVSPKN